MPGMGLTSYPNQYEVNKSDKDKINNKVKTDAQYLKTKEFKEKSNQKPVWQNVTTPTAESAASLSHIKDLYQSTNTSNENTKKDSFIEYKGPVAPTKKSEGKVEDLSDKINASENGIDSEGKPLPTPVKEKPVPTSTPITKTKAKSSGSKRNSDLENEGKTKEWYENLANSSYANDKKYEADMQAYNKMKSDEIAKNGYYTDSQGVKVYAKAISDASKEKKNA